MERRQDLKDDVACTVLPFSKEESIEFNNKYNDHSDALNKK